MPYTARKAENIKNPRIQGFDHNLVLMEDSLVTLLTLQPWKCP